jgi:hypothetical protein
LAQEIIGRVKKWNGIKFKSFHIAAKMINSLKRQPREGEKIFTIYVSDSGFMSRIYKELKTLNTKRANNPIQKWVNELNRHFSNEVQMANKRMKHVQHL